ncbi:MAG: MarR family transcriptional regulator [Candidatus Marinimicrobia bacterium]|nr:MarR family transcriptional regulator [Candidatus Neomarinimicrobiota bacterium]
MSTHYKGSSEEQLALDTFIKLTRAINTVGRLTRASIESNSITVSQFGVLEMLYHIGPLCQKDISEKLLLTGGNMVTVIDNLERDGLVERRVDPKDRRSKRVFLSKKGQSLIANIFPAHVHEIVRVLSVLSADEQQQLGNLLKKLGTSNQ